MRPRENEGRTMCLAIPMRVAAIEDQMATIESQGLTQRVSLLLVPDARVGDYVLVHAGCAIAVLGEQEATETLDLLREVLAFEDREEAGGFEDHGDS